MGCTQSVRPDVRDDDTEVPQTRETSVSIETRFVPLEDLKQHGRFPRFGSSPGFVHPVTGEGNANLCRSRDSFDALSTIFIFVSHRWLRPGRGAMGHPDDDVQSKYKLLLQALELLVGGPRTIVPAGVAAAIWLDFCCIDQRARPSQVANTDAAPASELENLGGLISGCDLMLTPVVDGGHAEWAYPVVWRDYFSEYQAAGWQEYWSRSWCRVEALLAAVQPVADPAARAALFRGSLSAALAVGRRPHVLFGSKEVSSGRTPLFLPPLLATHYETYAPERGELTVESDRAVVAALTAEMRKAIVPLQPGWRGEYRGEGAGDGFFTYDDGDTYEGQFLDGKKHGRGRYVEACGNIYEGPYLHDKMHGEHGTCTYANGNVYSGSFEQNKRHGAGRYVLASGDVYDGEWVDNKKHGTGTLTSASGEVYAGEWALNQKHGRGTSTAPGGASHHGVWRHGVLEAGEEVGAHSC